MKQPLIALLALCAATGAGAEQATVAVAANFAWPMVELEALFEADGTHELAVASGSTGQLYAQIVNGAPYDVFLSADRERPRRLAESGLGSVPFAYAMGRLALWTREPGFTDGLTLDVLTGGNFRRLAIANPRLAPYGEAARQTLQKLELWESLQSRIVLGENVAQAFAMAETRNAEFGLVALAMAVAYPGDVAYVMVSAEYHEPIRQDAILLNRGRYNPAALAFIDFLQGIDARRIIAEAGFELP